MFFVQSTWPPSWISFYFLILRLSFFLKRQTRLNHRTDNLIEALLLFSLVTTVLVQMRKKYLFHNKFRMIIFHDQKTLSLNFKISCSQMFFNIGVRKNFKIFTGKQLCLSYFFCTCNHKVSNKYHCGWLGQHGPCCNTNMWSSFLNTCLSF